MAIHDYVIANQNGANTRSDLNNALGAIVSNNSSATTPTTTYAFQWWADTAADILKQRNAADSAWINILTLSTGAPLAGFLNNGTQNLTSLGIDDNATSTAITIDASENVRLTQNLALGNQIIDTWHPSYDAFHLGRSATLSAHTSIPQAELGANFHVNTSGAYEYKVSGYGATKIDQNDGRVITSVAAAGTAGGTATFTEKVRIDTDGLKFNGDTAAANALDDYETGTWTPTVTFGGASVGVVYTANTNGRYVKVGGVVYVSGCLFLSNKGSSTGNATIGGLPFAHLNSSEGTKGSGSIGQTNISFSAFPSILGSQSSLYLYDTTTAGTLGAIDNSNFSNASSVYFGVSYAAS